MHTRGLAVPQPCRFSAWCQALFHFAPRHFTESSKCHTKFCNSGSDLIINVHCFGEGASKVGESINSVQFLSIRIDGCAVFKVLVGI